MSGDVGAEVAAVLADHGPSGHVNSREGWVECECGERLQLPSGLTFDGYPEMWEEERKARDAHVADALAPLIAERVETAKVEALREAADVSPLDLATHGCGWRTLDHDSMAVKGYCGSTTAEALNDWLRDRAAALDPEATP